MNLSYGGRRDLFYERTSEEFLQRLVAGLQRVYPECYERTSDLPHPYQRYLCPHQRRVHAELVLLTAGSAAGLTTRVATNTSNDGHALVLYDRFVITLSKIDAPNLPPRPAEFRRMYSGYASLAQYPLGLDGFEAEAPVQVQNDASPVYVIVGHGPDPKHFSQLGFAHAHFVAPGGDRFFGDGLDLLGPYGPGESEGIHVPTPPRLPDILPRDG